MSLLLDTSLHWSVTPSIKRRIWYCAYYQKKQNLFLISSHSADTKKAGIKSTTVVVAQWLEHRSIPRLHLGGRPLEVTAIGSWGTQRGFRVRSSATTVLFLLLFCWLNFDIFSWYEGYIFPWLEWFCTRVCWGDKAFSLFCLQLFVSMLNTFHHHCLCSV